MATTRQLFQFHVSLIGIQPDVWRRIQVPSTYSFWDLHVAIQDAMGWWDCHLHEFRLRNPEIGEEERIGSSYYCCGAAITKGSAICKPILIVQDAMDDFIKKLVGNRIATFLGKSGRATLKKLVEKELKSDASDPRPEIRRLKESLAEIARMADGAIDLATKSPEDRDFLTERLGRLRGERREIEGRLRELELIPVGTLDADAIVDSILKDLTDARKLFDQGTLEEQKRVIRVFIEGAKVVGSERCGEIRIRQLPALQSVSTGSLLGLVAGVGFKPTTFGL